MYFIRHETYKLLCRLLNLIINKNNEPQISESFSYPISKNLQNFNWHLPHLIADTLGKWFTWNTGKSFYGLLQNWFSYASLRLEVWIAWYLSVKISNVKIQKENLSIYLHANHNLPRDKRSNGQSWAIHKVFSFCFERLSINERLLVSMSNF